MFWVAIALEKLAVETQPNTQVLQETRGIMEELEDEITMLRGRGEELVAKLVEQQLPSEILARYWILGGIWLYLDEVHPYY